MGYYDIDYDASTWQNLPVRLRQAVMYAWCKALIAPILNLAALFGTNRANNLYNLAHNSQVCFLEAVLNDVFDSTLRRIYISDPAYIDPDWWALDDEEEPDWWALDSESAPVWWPLDSEVYYIGGVQFIVNVPAAVVFDMNRMRAVINIYRLASKNNYSVVIF